MSYAWDWEAARLRCLHEARRLLNCPADAEEAAQEALLRAWRMRHRCKNPGQPLPWIAQIARNESLRIAARQRARAERPLDEDEHAIAHDGQIDTRCLEHLGLGKGLGCLSVDDLELVCLRYSADLTYRRIAQLVGLPEGTVKVRLHRARARLRREIEGSM